jgi:predicted nuclease of predicted toxin-antitoxin system
LQYARENDWILLTFDDDFRSLVDGDGLDHAGVIHLQQAGRRIGDVVKAVDAHLDDRDEDDRTIQFL